MHWASGGHVLMICWGFGGIHQQPSQHQRRISDLWPFHFTNLRVSTSKTELIFVLQPHYSPNNDVKRKKKRHARVKLIGIILKGRLSTVLFVLNWKWQVQFLGKNLVNCVEMKFLAKCCGRSVGNKDSVWSTAEPQHI